MARRWKPRVSASDGNKTELKAYAADRRWHSEIAGTTLDMGGGVLAPVPTDRESRAALKQARDMLRDGELLDLSGNVRSDADVVIGNFVATLTDAQMTAFLQRSAQHVQAAFATQASLIAAINAGTVTTTAEIDAAAWP